MARVPGWQAADDSKGGALENLSSGGDAGRRGLPAGTVRGPVRGVSRSSVEGIDWFTETGLRRAYHTDRCIVNKVTFYLTFC